VREAAMDSDRELKSFRWSPTNLLWSAAVTYWEGRSYLIQP
jgi:hypothetical protein